MNQFKYKTNTENQAKRWRVTTIALEERKQYGGQ